MMLKQGLHNLLSQLTGTGQAEMGIPQEGDVFLVSYPRSGNTWVRTIIAHLLYGENSIKALDDLDVLVPDVHRGIPSRAAGTSYVIKTHHLFSYRQYRRQHDYTRVIYLVRHPYEVASSYFDYLCAINPARAGASFPDFIECFTQGAVWPGSWREHVLSWFAVRDKREFLVIRYEDLLDDPASNIQAVADFLDCACDAATAEYVADRCSRKNMVKMESQGSLVRSDYDFVRRLDKQRLTAKELTSDLKAKIDKRCDRALRVVGYLHEKSQQV